MKVGQHDEANNPPKQKPSKKSDVNLCHVVSQWGIELVEKSEVGCATVFVVRKNKSCCGLFEQLIRNTEWVVQV